MTTEVNILGISFSPRHGNTEVQLREALKAAEELPGVTTEFYNIVGRKLPVFPESESRKPLSGLR